MSCSVKPWPFLAGDGLLTEAFRIMAQAALKRGQDRNRGPPGHMGSGGRSRYGRPWLVDRWRILKPNTKSRPANGLSIFILARPGPCCGRRSAWALGSEGRARKQYACLDRYGTAVGLAFQVTDDILDIEGGTAKTGKRVGRDAELNKATYPAALGMKKTKRYARELLDEALTALQSFSPKAEPLRQIARFVVERAVPSET